MDEDDEEEVENENEVGIKKSFSSSIKIYEEPIVVLFFTLVLRSKVTTYFNIE